MDRIKWETHLLSFARSKTSLSQGVSGKIRPPPKNETEAFQGLRSEWSEKVRNHEYLSTSFSKSLSTVSIGLIKGKNHRKPWVFFTFHGKNSWFPVDIPSNPRKSVLGIPTLLPRLARWKIWGNHRFFAWNLGVKTEPTMVFPWFFHVFSMCFPMFIIPAKSKKNLGVTVYLVPLKLVQWPNGWGYWEVAAPETNPMVYSPKLFVIPSGYD